jgi:hypothetical protein
MLGGQGQQAIARQQAPYDSVCEALLSATRRYEERLGVLKARLEANNAKVEGRDLPQPAPIVTIQQQLGEICSRINVCNEGMEGIIDRLSEYVGELKILP